MGSSRLVDTLSGFLGEPNRNKQGAWIFRNFEDRLSKYYCGSAYQPSHQLLKAIDQFSRNELQELVLSPLHDNSQIVLTYRELEGKLREGVRMEGTCWFIYLHAAGQHCQHCRYGEDTAILK